ncbi:exodeoxyribonuclease 7 large subunit [Planctomycetales bacterium]|nr:exodeoxyribonuclease 7 large subunit [Planctomycetales bacterium]GHS98161.1 exodeoxyribonuclease 7 large subunit [Planctomycetales bacterium]GHT05322.1 exodeoxyribonuclease 7 large subunit [Planctomycetales bacterium]
MLDFRENPAAPLTITQLTRRLKTTLENNFSAVTATGEISQFTVAPSGHWYFSLKDAGAKIDAVMWQTAAGRTPRPQVGEVVEVGGKISVYEPRGNYQLQVNWLRPTGAGDARAKRLALLEKLRAEGWLAPERKKKLPPFARVFGLVTSPTGAAVRDMIKLIRKRFPPARMLLSPCLVQGAGAPAAIVAALKKIDGRCEVILLGRGGGAAEDLAAFDDEGVARAVAACRTPVISSVGHEIDTSVCDLVADVRAATPSEAAEIATREHPQMSAVLAGFFTAAHRATAALIAARRERLAALSATVARQHPAAQLRRQQQQCDELSVVLRRALSALLERRRERYKLLDARLAALNPNAVLRRGFSITRNAAGKILRSAQEATTGEKLQITLADGEVSARVERAEFRVESLEFSGGRASRILKK